MTRSITGWKSQSPRQSPPATHIWLLWQEFLNTLHICSCQSNQLFLLSSFALFMAPSSMQKPLPRSIVVLSSQSDPILLQSVLLSKVVHFIRKKPLALFLLKLSIMPLLCWIGCRLLAMKIWQSAALEAPVGLLRMGSGIVNAGVV